MRSLLRVVVSTSRHAPGFPSAVIELLLVMFPCISDVQDDAVCNGMGITRIPTDPTHYTFKAGIGAEHAGRCIDHILSKGPGCSASVSQNGRFLSDHMPIVASIEITGIEKNQGNRLKQSTIPTIKAGDTEAKEGCRR